MSDTGGAEASAAEAEVNNGLSPADKIKAAASSLAETTSSSETEGQTSPTGATAKDIAASISATPEQTVAIVDLGTAIKSASNTADQVAKAETQSLSAQTGAQVAHGNAVAVLKARFAAAVHHLGEEVAAEVKKLLAEAHDAEAVVEKVFASSGA